VLTEKKGKRSRRNYRARKKNSRLRSSRRLAAHPEPAGRGFAPKKKGAAAPPLTKVLRRAQKRGSSFFFRKKKALGAEKRLWVTVIAEKRE